jgi:hypothetical protein
MRLLILETDRESLIRKYWRKVDASLCAKSATGMAPLKTYYPITRVFSEGWNGLPSVGILNAPTTMMFTITVPTALAQAGDHI